MIDAFFELALALWNFAGTPIGFISLLEFGGILSLPILCAISDRYWGTCVHCDTHEETERTIVVNGREVSYGDWDEE